MKGRNNMGRKLGREVEGRGQEGDGGRERKGKEGKTKGQEATAPKFGTLSSPLPYLEILCCNALSTCIKVVDLLFLNYVVKKIAKIALNLTEL
jgi:hypothetical protein